VPYLLLGLQDVQWATARTPHVNKKKIKKKIKKKPKN
jgi:hypothetical protein